MRFLGQGARAASLIGVMCALAFGAVDAPAATARQRPDLVPAAGVLFGSWVDFDRRWTNNHDAEAEVAAFETQIGRRLAIDHHYYAWTDRFPSGLEQWDIGNGRIPLISWKGTTLSDILDGSFDGMIRARARAVRALHTPVFLRFAWEMNGRWEAWSGYRNGGADGGPSRYIRAWRHVHAIFDHQHATNAAWVWAPAHQDGPPAPWNHWTHYYPGDRWVDWVGIDAFNWGTSTRWGHWASFRDLIEPVYRDYAGRKPIMIAETGSAKEGGDKPWWFTYARRNIEHTLPYVRAVVYFNAMDHAYDTNWRATTTAVSGSAFRAWALDPYFNAQPLTERRPVEGAFVWPRQVLDQARVAFTLSGPASVSIEIRTAGGKTVRHLLTDAPYPRDGSFAVPWDRADDAGVLVAPGWYVAVVTTQGGSSTGSSESVCGFRTL
ncbi:MAG: glycosyl hydrolase [Actinomycetota bacterium]